MFESPTAYGKTLINHIVAKYMWEIEKKNVVLLYPNKYLMFEGSDAYFRDIIDKIFIGQAAMIFDFKACRSELVLCTFK